ncbi:hypothetical protein WJX73_010635 [Symbiochloris irregularis]|uniref:AP2/ERF domain-containing protein n=1 Tax=Symbiochloris irregularis TaxID=706552 RepID=A0AAW1PW95_9CHLO
MHRRSSASELREQSVEQPSTESDRTLRRSGPRSATSRFLGVTKYKRTGRWESHIWWGNGRQRRTAGRQCGRPKHGHKKPKKGCQLHLGSFTRACDAGL